MLALTWDSTGFWKVGFLYPMQFLAVGTALFLLLGFRIGNRRAGAVAAASLVALVLSNLVIDPPDGIDLDYFWRSGLDVRAGLDPYRNEFCLNPPHTFSLYWLFAQLAFDRLLFLWTAVNIVCCAVLVAAAQAALTGTGDADDWRLPLPVLGVLTGTVALSVANRYCIHDGQLSLFITLMLCGALWARHRGHPLLAGAALAVASFKTATMLPFLLLFRRRSDRLAWVALAVTGFGLYFLANPPGELLQRLQECQKNIAVLASPGHMNNFSHPVNFYMISLERAIYYLGISDRDIVRLTSLAVLGVLAVWLVLRTRGANAVTAPAACCLVALYSAIFLYHRIYDMPILALPLVYVAGRARTEVGLARWLYAGCGAAVLGVLYLRLETVKYLGYHPGVGLGSRILEGIVVPYGVWLILAGMALLSAAERCRSAQAAVVTDEPARLAA